MDLDMELELAAAAARAKRNRKGDPLKGIGLINTGIARGIDTMAGPLNRGVNAVLGTELSETPTADLFAAGDVAMREPEGMAGRAVVGAGEAASYLVPATGLMRAAMGGAGTMAQAGQTLAAPFINAPKATIAGEMAAGAGLNIAGDLSDQATGGNALARSLAEVAGGVAGGLGVSGLARGASALAPYTPIALVARGIKSAALPFTRSGGRIIAEDGVRRMAADPDRAADILLRDENVGNLTPAQQTGEPGLMALERGFAERSPALAESLQGGVAQSRQALDSAAREGAQGRTAQDTRAFFEERIKRHETFLTGLLDRAQQRADAALRDVEPRGRPMAHSEFIRGEVDRAFEVAGRQEQQKWSRVPRTVEIQTSQARAALRSALEETTDVSADSIPGKALKFLGDGDSAFGDTVTMSRLHRLYSEMRKAQREAMAQAVPDEFRARQARGIADAILQDIEATNPQNAANLLADARAFSAQMNETFGRYDVGALTSVARSGADRVQEGLTLDATMGAMGNRGALAVDNIRRAIGASGDRSLTDYLRDAFTRGVVRGDQIDIPRAEAFVSNNRELIDRFPDGFKPAMERAISAARTAGRRGEQVADALKVLGDRNAPGQVGFVNAKAGQEVAKTIFDADNPSRAARALVTAAQREGTGDAYLGLKGGVVDEVISRAMKGDRLTGDALFRQINDPQVMGILRAVLPPEELSRLRVVATQLRKLDTWESVTPEAFENAPNALVSTFLQVQAAKAGRAVGTGTIQVPGMFVKRVRDIMSRVAVDHADALLHEAMRDPKMLAALLTGPGSSRAQIRRAEEAFTTWATGTLAASGEE